MTDQVYETQGLFRVLEVPWNNMGFRQVEQGFSSFFCHFWWFFKVKYTSKDFLAHCVTTTVFHSSKGKKRGINWGVSSTSWQLYVCNKAGGCGIEFWEDLHPIFYFAKKMWVAGNLAQTFTIIASAFIFQDRKSHGIA